MYTMTCKYVIDDIIMTCLLAGKGLSLSEHIHDEDDLLVRTCHGLDRVAHGHD